MKRKMSIDTVTVYRIDQRCIRFDPLSCGSKRRDQAHAEDSYYIGQSIYLGANIYERGLIVFRIPAGVLVHEPRPLRGCVWWDTIEEIQLGWCSPQLWY
jgi:hypothetical protein